mmetsp:Transcript_41021/g.123802  ORF Transcript_41021/g.123802 Transcript_41021/m.123802 type:complete len:315 (-) Transcript_41021:549-1493(-)
MGGGRRLCFHALQYLQGSIGLVGGGGTRPRRDEGRVALPVGTTHCGGGGARAIASAIAIAVAVELGVELRLRLLHLGQEARGRDCRPSPSLGTRVRGQYLVVALDVGHDAAGRHFAEHTLGPPRGVERTRFGVRVEEGVVRVDSRLDADAVDSGHLVEEGSYAVGGVVAPGFGPRVHETIVAGDVGAYGRCVDARGGGGGGGVGGVVQFPHFREDALGLSRGGRIASSLALALALALVPPLGAERAHVLVGVRQQQSVVHVRGGPQRIVVIVVCVVAQAFLVHLSHSSKYGLDPLRGLIVPAGGPCLHETSVAV